MSNKRAVKPPTNPRQKAPQRERCPKCGRRERRSVQANARYWLLVHLIAEKVKPEGTAYSAEVWHTYFKSKYLGCEETLLPNGKTVQIPRSSADLDTPEFSAFMSAVEEWALTRDVWLADTTEAA